MMIVGGMSFTFLKIINGMKVRSQILSKQILHSAMSYWRAPLMHLINSLFPANEEDCHIETSLPYVLVLSRNNSLVKFTICSEFKNDLSIFVSLF